MRRGDPERIYQAQRAGVFRRLVDAERVNDLDAEHWIARWEREAEATDRERGSQAYWDDAWRWIEAEQRMATGQPPAQGLTLARSQPDD